MPPSDQRSKAAASRPVRPYYAFRRCFTLASEWLLSGILGGIADGPLVADLSRTTDDPGRPAAVFRHLENQTFATWHCGAIFQF